VHTKHEALTFLTVNKSGLLAKLVPHDVHRETADFILFDARY
jgi:hypothetical protein